MNRKKPQLLLGFLGFQPVHPLLSHIQVYFDFSGNISIVSQATLWAWWLNVSLLIICCCSVAQSCLTFYDPMKCSIPDSLSFNVSRSLLKFMSIESGCHPTISSSATPFFSCPQSFPASGSFPLSQLFTSGGQCTGASASVLTMNIQHWFPLGLTGLISLKS